MLRVTGLVELFLIRNSTPNAENTRSGQQRSKVGLHLESSPRIGDYGTPLIEHRRVTLLFGTQPFFATVLFFLGGGRGWVTSIWSEIYQLSRVRVKAPRKVGVFHLLCKLYLELFYAKRNALCKVCFYCITCLEVTKGCILHVFLAINCVELVCLL